MTLEYPHYPGHNPQGGLSPDDQLGGGDDAPDGPCPPGQERHPTRGDCRYPGDYPCPSGLCKDVVSGQCRTPGGREKVNETDDTERPGGGGRGYCRQIDPGRPGRGGGYGEGGPNPGGGQGGQGGNPGGGGFGNSSPQQTFDDRLHDTNTNFQSIWDELLPVMQGKTTRYNPETMGYLEGAARVDRAGNIEAGRDSIYDDAIDRGMGRSGATSAAISNVVTAANRTYAQTVTQLRVKKVEQDFEDRMGGLDRAQKALDSRQAYILGLDQTQAQRERDIANVALGYARIAAERAMLSERLRVDMQIAQMNDATTRHLGDQRNMTDILLGG